MSLNEAEITLPNGLSERALQDSATKRFVEVIAETNRSGSGTVARNPMSEYELSDFTDESVDPMYEGFVRSDGAWAIKKTDRSGNPRTLRFAAGASDYTTNWNGRAGLVYDLFSAIF